MLAHVHMHMLVWCTVGNYMKHQHGRASKPTKPIQRRREMQVLAAAAAMVADY